MSNDLNWVRTGKASGGTVVLLHSVGLDLTYWDRQIEALRGTHDVIALDLPGHGASSARPANCGFDDVASVVADLVTHLRPGGAVHVVGLSFGAMVAQSLALSRPELVRSLTLIGSTPVLPESARLGLRTHADSIEAHGMSAALPGMSGWFTKETFATRPDLIDRVTKTLNHDDPGVHATMWRMIAEYDVLDRLREITCPALVLVGDQDTHTPPAVAAMIAERIVGARMLVLPGASHIAPVEIPAAINAELRAFLS